MSNHRSYLAFLLVVPAAIVGFLYKPSVARSLPGYPPLLPNRAYATNSGNMSMPCITCHNNPDGGQGCQPMTSWPCLNPFGLAFQSGGKFWSPTLAALDSDGDGYSNGQELQDPAGAWIIGQPSPGIASYVTRPGFSAFSPGQSDADQDRYCYFGHDTNSDGDCLDAGENTADRDCNDAVGSINSVAPELCTNTIDDNCDGLDTFSDPTCASVVDHDRDGYCPIGQDNNADRDCTDPGEAAGMSDCDDYNVLVRPNAAENCSDGIDNDCDTFIDAPDDSNCTGEDDADNDGYCPIGRDTTDNAGTGGPDGDCLDAGEPAMASDCNDYDAVINPGASEICGDLQDNNCNELADFDDALCANDADSDHDGYCVNGKDVNGDGNCLSLNGGTDIRGTAAGWDCDDDNASVYSLAPEDCLDGADQDCDPLYDLGDPECYGYLDQDHDQYCPIGGIDTNNDHDCADPSESSPYSDCDDTRSAVSPIGDEGLAGACFNRLDDDCNGSTDATFQASDPKCVAYTDWDYDGYCALGRDTVDDAGAAGPDGDCTDPGEQTVDVDDFPYDGTISPGRHESCFDYKDNDQDGSVDLDDFDCDVANNPMARQDTDGDGYCPVGRDVNGDGDCVDTGENYGQSDCDETNVDIGPQSAEIYLDDRLPEEQRCVDHQDTDCDGKVDLADPDCGYLFDLDGDHVCGHGRNDNPSDMDNDCLDTDEQRNAFDCDETNAQRASIFSEICSNGIDDDCDGNTDIDDSNCRCQLDVECTGAAECQIGRCDVAVGVCTYIADPQCTEGRARSKGLCGVTAAGAGGAGGIPVLVLAAIVAASLVARRRMATVSSRRSGRRGRR